MWSEDSLFKEHNWENSLRDERLGEKGITFKLCWHEGYLDRDCFGEGRFGKVSFEGFALDEGIGKLLAVVKREILMRILVVLFQ